MTTCVICRRGPGEVKLGVKGFISLLKVSAQRNDDLFATLGPEERSVHEHCRKSYTSSFNVLKAQKNSTDTFQPCVLRSVTSDGSEFEFKTHCIIYTKKIDFEEIQKHKRRHSGVSHVEIVGSQKKSLLQETLLSICNERTDDKAADIKAHIIFAGDIRAAEATYHRHCMQSFMSDHDRKRNDSSQESARDIQDKTFKSWCEELPVMTEHGKQFTVQDLLDQYASNLPPDMAPYSVKHFKRKLLQQLGSGITIAEVDGRPDIVTLTHHASSILYESYQDASETSAEQNIKTARYLGRTVKDLIKKVTSDSDKYPEPTDVNIDSLEHQIPKVIEAGEKCVSSLYSSTDDIYRLDDLRYLFAVSTKFTSVERMPPTSSACAFHSLRVHHQVSTWIHLKTVLDKHEHGFQTVNNTITPVITDKGAAPANLLKEIRCSCSAGSQLCNNCSCFKKRIPCSIHCKCKGSCLNPSPFVRAITEE